MANTTNLNLSKLAGTEKLKSFPSPYNDNMDAIDDAFGSGFGVGNNSSVNNELNGLGKGMAIIANGNTHAAITSRQYVYVRQHDSLSEGLYQATSNISANGTLSGSNLTAVSSGGLNALNTNLISRTRPSENPIAYTLKTGFSLESWGQINIRQVGGLLVVNVGGLTTNHEISADEEFLTLTNYTISNMGSAYSLAWLTSRDKPGNVSAFSGKIYLNRIPANAVMFFQITIPVYI